jgi:uncharacterized repeat protein (TIGR02543 family)
MRRNSFIKKSFLSLVMLPLIISQTNLFAWAETINSEERETTASTLTQEMKSGDSTNAIELPKSSEQPAIESTELPEQKEEQTQANEGVGLSQDSAHKSQVKPLSGNLATFDGTALNGTADAVSYVNYTASVEAKTLVISANFDASAQVTSRKLKIELVNGLGFTTVPGMVATDNNKNNWRFDASTLPTQLQGVISNATYVPNENISGLVQPKAGTVIYEFNPGTNLVNLSLGIVTDRTLTISKGDFVISNPLTVTSLENDTVKTIEILESMTLTGKVYPVLYASGWTQSLTLKPGEEGSLRKYLVEQNDVTPLIPGNMLVEQLAYVYKVEKNAGLSSVTFPDNPSALTVTIDRDSDSTYDYVYVTIGRTCISSNNYLSFNYQTAEDVPTGRYSLSLVSAHVTANGQTFAETGDFTKTPQIINIFSESNVTIKNVSNNYYAYNASIAEDHMSSLGGFAISNLGSQSDSQKMQLKFEDSHIGVRAVSLPYEENGTITDIVVKTNKGQTFTVPSATGIKMNEAYGFSQYRLVLGKLGTISSDEYITEVTYNMGEIKAGAAGLEEFRGAANMEGQGAGTYNLALSYHGKLLSVPTSKTYNGATATLVAANKDFTDASAVSATNTMKVVDAGGATFTSGTNIKNGMQVLSGTVQSIRADLNLAPFPYGKDSPSLVKGFDVYLRSGEYLNINSDTIAVTYEGQTYRVADGTLVAIPTTDNTGNMVYKIELPEVILGWAKADSFDPFSKISLVYDVKVKSDAPTVYIPTNELVYIAPRGLQVTKQNGAQAVHNNPDIYDVNGNDNTSEYMGTLNKTIGLQVVEQKDFRVTTAANINDGPWGSYDYDTNSEIIDLNPSGKTKYQLTVNNNSGSSIEGYTALIPVPKAGEQTDLTPASPQAFNASEHLQKEAFTWTASLLEEINYTGSLNCQFLYATTYETDKDSTNFKTWNQISDKNAIRMIKVVTTDSIPDQFSESIEFPLALTDPNADANAGKVNIYSARIYREILGTAGYKPSEPIAIRLQTGVVSGQVFNDTNYNGVKDASESGHNGVTVKAYEAGSNPPKLIGTSVTKTINGKDGCYEFLGLSKLKNVDIVFVNPATNGEFRFSPTTNGGSMPTPAAGHTEAKISNFTPSSTGYNKMDAGLIAPVTITLNAGDGSTAEDKLSRYPGEKIETKPTAELAGHTFQGWFTEEKAGTEISFPYTAGKQNTTFYAHYRANSYKVNYHNEDQTETKEVVYGELLKEPTKPSKTGQTFIGWFTEPTGGRAWNFDEETMPANDIDLYARFGTAVHDVTFDTGSNTAKKTYEYNSLIEKPNDPVKKGHTFKGWFTAQTGGREWNFTQDKMPDNDLTLYARFEINQYVISYVVDDAVVKTDPAPYNSLLTQPADPDKAGYALEGWFNEETGEQWVFAKDKVPDKNLTLVARFTKKTYTLTFDNDGEKTVQEVVFDELAAEPTTPVKTGYTFDGWYDDETGAKWNFSENKMPSKNKTLKARYTINHYTVTFDDKGTRTTEEVAYNSLLTKPAEPQAAPGYAFVGWQEQTNQELWDFTKNKMPANDLLLIAQFEASDQEITLDFNGGTSTGPDHITAPTDSEVNIDAIVQPTKPGYQFVGWFNGVDQVNGVITMPVGGLELKAKWEEADQVIYFDANGGSGVDSVVAKTDAAITIEEYTTTREGYQFLGWFDENDQHVTGEFIVPAGGATFTAKWQALDQTITFDVNGGDIATQPAPIVQPTDAKVKLDVLRKPERTGYIFIGWYDAAGKKYSGTIKMPVGGLALIAKWEDEPVEPTTDQKDNTTTNNKGNNNKTNNNKVSNKNKGTISTNKSNNKKQKDEKTLPNNGEKKSPIIGIAGLVVVAGALALVLVQRRQKLSNRK